MHACMNKVQPSSINIGLNCLYPTGDETESTARGSKTSIQHPEMLGKWLHCKADTTRHGAIRDDGMDQTTLNLEQNIWTDRLDSLNHGGVASGPSQIQPLFAFPWLVLCLLTAQCVRAPEHWPVAQKSPRTTSTEWTREMADEECHVDVGGVGGVQGARAPCRVQSWSVNVALRFEAGGSRLEMGVSVMQLACGQQTNNRRSILAHSMIDAHRQLCFLRLVS